MTRALRIAVADDETDMRDYFAAILPRLGHQVVALAGTGRELVDACRLHRPDLVITDIKMPDMDGIDAAALLVRDGPLPVILVSAYHDPDLVARAAPDYILGFLVKPVKQADLPPAIALAMRRFEQFQELRRQADDLRQTLEDRKIVERAKGLLMKTLGLDETQAYRRLQKTAMNANRRIVEVAQVLLGATLDDTPPPESSTPRAGKSDKR